MYTGGGRERSVSLFEFQPSKLRFNKSVPVLVGRRYEGGEVVPSSSVELLFFFSSEACSRSKIGLARLGLMDILELGLCISSAVLDVELVWRLCSWL